MTPLAPALSRAAAAAFLAFAACSNGSSTPAIVVEVLDTDPIDGATEVDPATVIVLRVGPDGVALRPEDFAVHDGGNELRGELVEMPSFGVWVWTPEQELPRGSQVEVTLEPQGRIATFSVRDIAPGATYTLGGDGLADVFAWPNGRRAVLTDDGDLFEMREIGQVLRLVDVPVGARTFGDGGFVGERLDAGVRYCVRGDIDGGVEMIETPSGAAIGDVDRLGNVVVHVPPGVGTPTAGLWRLMRGDAQFSLAGAVEVESGFASLHIEADGTVAVAFARPPADRVELVRFEPGDLVGRSYSLPIPDGLAAGRVHFDAGDDGRGVLGYTVWRSPPGEQDTFVARVARFDPMQGLKLLSDELGTWSVGLWPPEVYPFGRLESVRVGAYGSAVVELANGTTSQGNTTAYRESVRIEPDDSIGERVFLAQTFGLPVPGARIARTPLRAEQWTLTTFDLDTLFLSRSRPGMTGDDNYGLLYQAPPTSIPFTGWGFAVDDSGRAIVAVEQDAGATVSTRVVLYQ